MIIDYRKIVMLLGFGIAVSLFISGMKNEAATTELGNYVTTGLGGGLICYFGIHLARKE